MYGTKSAGASWRTMLAETMRDLKFQPSHANPDVWIPPMVKPDGFEYYEMVFSCAKGDDGYIGQAGSVGEL